MTTDTPGPGEIELTGHVVEGPYGSERDGRFSLALTVHDMKVDADVEVEILGDAGLELEEYVEEIAGNYRVIVLHITACEVKAGANIVFTRGGKDCYGDLGLIGWNDAPSAAPNS